MEMSNWAMKKIEPPTASPAPEMYTIADNDRRRTSSSAEPPPANLDVSKKYMEMRRVIEKIGPPTHSPAPKMYKITAEERRRTSSSATGLSSLINDSWAYKATPTFNSDTVQLYVFMA